MALRTIDTDGLKCLGPEKHGPWLLDEDRLLRTSMDTVPLRTEAAAQAVFDVYRSARLAGAPTPDALEVVQVAGGYGVVVEYVVGLPLGMHLLFGSYSIEMTGSALGTLARRLHAVRMGAGCNWGALFARRAREFSTLLSSGAGNRLVSLVEEIPPSDTLVHGDLHVANVVVLGEECRLIDMETAGFGHPAFDLAIARSRLAGAANSLAVNVGVERRVGDRVWRRVWRALLQSYFEDASESALDDLSQRFEVLAQVDTYRQLCADGPGGVDRLDDSQKLRLAACIQRVEDTLPRVTRLDF